MSYELVPLRIPRDAREIELAEDRLDELARLGGKIIGFMPSARSEYVLVAFETSNARSLRANKTFDAKS